MRLIITRHGETVFNTQRLFQSQTSGELTLKGVSQAKKLGDCFKSRNIDVAYSSDSVRTMNTAKEILVYHPNLSLITDERLREQGCEPVVGEVIPENFDWDNIPIDFEQSEAFISRVQLFIDFLILNYSSENILIVCHAGTKKALLTVLHKKPHSELNKWDVLLNTSVSEFDLSKDGIVTPIIFNCTSHLD